MGKKIKIPLGSRAPKAGKSIKSMKGALKGALKGSSMKRPQKGPTKPTKSVKPIQQKRRDSSSSSSSLSSALNLSDDDGYSAVEDVPDSDDDEEHVFAVEEEHIILREKHRKKDVPPSPPRPISDPEDEDAADADDDDSDDDMSDQAAFIDEELSFDDASSTASSGREIFFDNLPPLYSTSMDEQSQTPVERHVRFAGVPDSDSDSDETEDDHDDVFPDIFIPQSALEPNFRREIEQDDDDGDSYSSDTFWDYTNGAEFEDDGDMDPEPNDMNMLSTDQIMPELSNLFGNSQLNAGDNGRHQSGVSGAPSPKEEDASSDGYESDGETTEEDEPVLIPRKKTTTAPRAASEEASASPDADRAKRTDKGKSPAGRLVIGSRRKPICILNPVTRKMMIITPHKQRRFDLSPSQFRPEEFSLLNNTELSPCRIDSLGMSAMWPAGFQPNMFGTFDPDFSLFGNGYDFPDPDSEESFLGDGDEDDGEKNLNIHDFINLDDLISNADENDEHTDEGNAGGAETPSRRPSAAPSGNSESNTDVHPLLEHLTNNADRVGAFRLNQVNQQLILNGQATQESLAFSNPLYHGTLRGIKHGNLSGAATPLTPERRHKKSFAKSPSELTQRKRKAPDVDNSVHKKQRSISDVRKMHI